MAEHTLRGLFQDIADSIRSKTGSSSVIVADQFPAAIDAIITDPTGDATITSNSQLLNGVTAYGKGTKYTGNIDTYDWSYEPDIPPYLCFTANTAGSTITTYNSVLSGVNFQYSSDGTNWNELVIGDTVITLVNAGEKVYFKGNNPNGIMKFWEDTDSLFVMTGSIAASGNIMSLIDNGACTCTTVPCISCFGNLFWGCTALTSAPELPATTLAPYSYVYMFRDTSITEAPELPATETNYDCYSCMFYGCTNLTTAPKLPATTLTEYCYAFMFENCTSLTTVPALPATTLASSCYNRMFDGCTSLVVSDTSGSGHTTAWTIPSSGTFANTYSQENMFRGCAGTRSSNDMAGASGQSYTYYTQNTPV